MESRKHLLVPPSDLVETLERHSQWLLNRQGGTPADLALQNLYGYDLTGANLRDALIAGANFTGTVLTDTRFGEADISGVIIEKSTAARIMGAA